jgi:beta-phosphoglucomutase-like phosphatase (HAD superfamily)
VRELLNETAAFIFDLDGTLIDSLPYHILAFKDVLLEKGIRISDQKLRRLT